MPNLAPGNKPGNLHSVWEENLCFQRVKCCISILILPPPSKGQTCSGLSLAPAIPSAGGASRALRIQAPRIFVDFWPLSQAFPSQISVCAKVVLHTEARFHAGLPGGGLT